MENPCLSCGACCASFRVSFYWGEADPAQEAGPPLELTDPLPPFHRCMKGTNQSQPRCIALQGQVGKQATCAIYARRPSPCHEFGIQSEDGVLWLGAENLARCNHARAICGLGNLDERGIMVKS